MRKKGCRVRMVRENNYPIINYQPTAMQIAAPEQLYERLAPVINTLTAALPLLVLNTNVEIQYC